MAVGRNRAGRGAALPADRPLSVALVVGGAAQDAVRCGVRDYAICLAQALRTEGVAAQVIAPASWRLGDGLAFIRELRAAPPDVVHLQYPSIGFRHSLLPHLLGPSGAGRSSVVTLHEHSALPSLQRIANQVFRATADQIIFATAFEAAAFGGSLHPVIPIASNIPVHPVGSARGGTLLYFGQIRPGKGIEAFLALARLAEAAGDPADFTVIGSTPPRWREYSEGLRAEAPGCVAWREDASPSEVAEAMATACAAYLPFPDGAGLRRGSMMAALINGLPVIAPLGASTTAALQEVLFAAATPAEAFAQLLLMRSAPERVARQVAAGRALMQSFAWPSIAGRHVALYKTVLSRRLPVVAAGGVTADLGGQHAHEQ